VKIPDAAVPVEVSIDNNGRSLISCNNDCKANLLTGPILVTVIDRVCFTNHDLESSS
jgi:hypothetical protein